jgi:hypothetical protein
MFTPNKEAVTGENCIMRNFHDLYSLTNIIPVMKSNMSWARDVAHIEHNINAYEEFGLRTCYTDINIGGRMI